LALSFGVQADGTLPLPVSKEELPLDMSGNVEALSSITLRLDNLQSIPNLRPVISRDVANPCSGTDVFYEASGTILMNAETLAVQGVCAPLKKPETIAKRLIVATDGTIGVNGTSKKLVRLDGTVATDGVTTLSSFSGNLSIQPLGAPIAPMMTTMSLTSASMPGMVTMDLTPQASVPTVFKFKLLRN